MHDSGRSQFIEIQTKWNNVFAIKLVGDDCIKANELTWSGSLIEDRVLGFVESRNPIDW